VSGWRTFLVPLALLGACLSRAQDAKPAIGDCGLDLTARDPATKPGDDFYRYANGHWVDAFTIPEDRSNYTAFTKLGDIAEERIREIIGEAADAHAADGTAEQRIGDYYAAFMDEGAIEAAGLHPAQSDLDRIIAARSPGNIAAIFGSPGFFSAFVVGIAPDLKDPNRYSISIGQGGLGLPDRDYYLKGDPKFGEFREKYRALIEEMLGLGGIQDPGGKAHAILDFETGIARVSWSLADRRDVGKNYNPRTKAELLAYAPGFDWEAFFDAQEIGARDRFILGPLSAIRDIAALVQNTPLDTLKAYLIFHYLEGNASVLPKRFNDAYFAFYGQVLQGQPRQRDRWRRAVEAVDGALGEQVGQIYVRKYFPGESRAKMEALVDNLKRAFTGRIDKLDWMTPATKAKAHEKLARFTTKIGYPEKWKNYSSLVVRRDDPIGNSLSALVWDWHRKLERIDKPVDHSEWPMTPQTVNAFYTPSNNEIVFPAAILQPPFFDPNADPAVNYGGIGAVIGHEMTHGFDDQGRKFGPDGSLQDWWTEEDSKAFWVRAGKLMEEFGAFEPLPGLKIRGAVTLGENIADLGGLAIAYDAYRISQGGREPAIIDGLTGDQRFFLSWAQVFRSKYREGALRQQVMTDFHSPKYFRVNGQVRNLETWYRAFNVQPGDRMYVDPGERVKIW
jgi:putative endopeptidase